MRKILQVFKKETVLCIAALLAALSAFLVPPSAKYAEYIDFRTLAILFSLMTVMAGLRGQGVFDRLGMALLHCTHRVFSLVCVLVGLCFFFSMFITNDVALLTFVPFTFAVLSSLGDTAREALAVPVAAMQTVAANLGSMLMPIGNPQNLYLYGKSGMPLSDFVRLMLPYSLLALLLLLIWAALFCRRISQSSGSAIGVLPAGQAKIGKRSLILLYGVLFVICLGSVMRILPYGAAFLLVLLCAVFADRSVLSRVDYSLLFTFAAFFIFIGNLGQLPVFSAWLQSVLAGREVPVAVLASQVTSNVPAALLLSGFTDNTPALIVGTNLGGLGTLIASMASLISYRQVAKEMPQAKGRYFVLFTLSNLIFLALLLALWCVIG